VLCPPCRYTRLSNGFGGKLQNHEATAALNYSSYNLTKIHRTLRATPAMAAGSDGSVTCTVVWSSIGD